MAVRVKIKVNKETYRKLKETDYIDLEVEVDGGNVSDIFRLEKRDI